MPATTGLSANVSAFLDMIRMSEVGPLVPVSAYLGYDVIVGSTPGEPDLFSLVPVNGYVAHPNKAVTVGDDLVSTAAGAYQILYRYWRVYETQLALSGGFTPASQDAVALQMLHETGALTRIQAGLFEDAVAAASSRWASLPGNRYGQPTHTLPHLQAWFTQFGGTL